MRAARRILDATGEKGGGDVRGLVVQTNGPYLRVVPPHFEPDRAAVWSALDFELEEGIERAEVVAPCYPDDNCPAGVRALVDQLERRGVQTVVEWKGTAPLAKA